MEREGAPLGRERAAMCNVRAAMCPPTQRMPSVIVLEEEVGCPLWECATSQEGHTSLLACAQIQMKSCPLYCFDQGKSSSCCHIAFWSSICLQYVPTCFLDFCFC
jgi:hypothetical protein